MRLVPCAALLAACFIDADALPPGFSYNPEPAPGDGTTNPGPGEGQPGDGQPTVPDDKKDNGVKPIQLGCALEASGYFTRAGIDKPFLLVDKICLELVKRGVNVQSYPAPTTPVDIRPTAELVLEWFNAGVFTYSDDHAFDLTVGEAVFVLEALTPPEGDKAPAA